VRRLLEVTKADADARPAFLVQLVLTTAMKKHEMMALRVGDLALDAEPAHVAVKGKGHKRRNVTVVGELQRFYEAYVGQYGPVERLFPVSSRRLDEALDAEVSGSVRASWTTGLETAQERCRKVTRGHNR
jgi:site-specific recombinase XerC